MGKFVDQGGSLGVAFDVEGLTQMLLVVGQVRVEEMLGEMHHFALVLDQYKRTDGGLVDIGAHHKPLGVHQVIAGVYQRFTDRHDRLVHLA